MLGFLCEDMIRIGLPFIAVKLSNSKARVVATQSKEGKSMLRVLLVKSHI